MDMQEEPKDFQSLFEENVRDDVEATDDELKGVVYTAIFLLIFLVCVFAAIFFLVW
jgi:hypothetical protein